MRINSLTLALLATSAAAIPHRRDAEAQPIRRQVDVVTTFIDVLATPVVTVDQNGNPIATTYPVYTNPALDGADYGSPSDVYSAPPSQTATVPASSTSSASSSSTTSTDSDDADAQDITGFSIAYTPYNPDHSCKTQEQIDQDIDGFPDQYHMIRIYGTDCFQVLNVLGAAKRNNMKVFAGIWNSSNVAYEAKLLIDEVQDDWDMIHTVSVGNENLNSEASLQEVINGVNEAREILRGAGYNRPVTTVQIYSTLLEQENQGICDAVDYVAANCHAYFNAFKSAEEAGDYVRGRADALSEYCGGKNVIITESGWPTEGQTNGKAVPGVDNQRIALQSLRDAYADKPNELILFSAYNDPWKEDHEGTFGTEHYWGMYGDAPSWQE